MLRLSALLGAEVRTTDGDRLGKLVDLTVDVADDYPAVRRLAVGRRRRITRYVDWVEVVSFEHDGIQIRSSGVGVPLEVGLGPHELALRRDVLDTQIIDVAGRRMARVSEVLLTRTEVVLRVVAVDVSAAGVWRRLGIGRKGERGHEKAVDWADVHLTSTRGHALSLATKMAGVHRLGPQELASLVAWLPTVTAARILGAVEPETAAGALSASHPHVGARLLAAVPDTTASSMVELMAADDVAAILRHLDDDEVAGLVARLGSERAAVLRRLLTHPADTAGGLMNGEVRTALVGESAESIRDRLAADLPELEGSATVFVVDDQRRPVGCFEPNDLLAGRATPRGVPEVPSTLPADQVVDLFAVHDCLALPVVDAERHLIGEVTIDDVFEELVAERLPGESQYGRVRRRPRRRRRLHRGGKQRQSR